MSSTPSALQERSEQQATSPLLQVEDLQKHFPIERGMLRRVVGNVRAVDGVTFQVAHGESFGVVGESGSGKTTVARAIMGAVAPTGGHIWFTSEERGRVDIVGASQRELREYYREIQMIFQDPFASLNPRLTVLDIVAESLNSAGWKRERYEPRVEELLDLVGLDRAYKYQYPHAFSGGQRQRIGIARALAVSPTLVIADEPVSALDVSVQAQILNLLKDLQARLNLTYMLIAHDLSVIRYTCDRTAVMYLGRIMEQAATHALFSHPLHPYTSTLLKAVPEPDPEAPWAGPEVAGEITDSLHRPTGCPFAPRCPHVVEACRDAPPPLRPLTDKDGVEHVVACIRAEELDLYGVR